MAANDGGIEKKCKKPNRRDKHVSRSYDVISQQQRLYVHDEGNTKIIKINTLSYFKMKNAFFCISLYLGL